MRKCKKKTGHSRGNYQREKCITILVEENISTEEKHDKSGKIFNRSYKFRNAFFHIILH